jgi:hypothetical protein
MRNENEVEHEECKDYTIRIMQDDSPIDPRESDDYLMGTMLCFHRRYNLGDKHDLKHENFSSWGEIQEYLRKELRANIIIPLYLLDHSGLWIRAGRGFPEDSGGWDSGVVGFIYTTPKRIRNMYAIKHITKEKLTQAEKELYREVETYNDYLTGNVYGFIVEDPEGENIDSCWGFYGDEGMKEAYSQAKGTIDYESEKRTVEIDEAHAIENGEEVMA